MSNFRRLMMHKNISSSKPFVKLQDSKAGNILLYNRDSKKKRLVRPENYDIKTFPADSFIPIGIIAVPASHMDDGTARVISLASMDCDTPTVGNVNEHKVMKWGDNVLIDELPDVDYAPTCGSQGNVLEKANSFSALGSTVILPSDYFTNVINPYDDKTCYFIAAYHKYVPSPYKNDGTQNDQYKLTTGIANDGNCLAYFNGKEYTNVILTLRGSKDYSLWKPTYNNVSDYPAASCCDMYFTEGTRQHEWYLPSSGEFGYVVSRRKSINESIQKIINTGKFYALLLSDDDSYSTSARHGQYGTVSFSLSSGLIGNANRSADSYTRAFLSVSEVEEN